MTDEIFILKSKGVKETPNRILVLRELKKTASPVSIGELETQLATLDKSSIFRVLNHFLLHDVVHALNGIDGITRYELCHGESRCTLNDMHPHFCCVLCQRIFCFDKMSMPLVEFPDGFETKSVSYMAQGICPACAEKKD